MIPAVLLLAKYSVFEMLWLESGIQQTNGTFVFCHFTDIGDWKSWWRLVFNSAFLLLVCCNVRLIYLYYLPFTFHFYNWNYSFVYFRKTEQWWISPGLHPQCSLQRKQINLQIRRKFTCTIQWKDVHHLIWQIPLKLSRW